MKNCQLCSESTQGALASTGLSNLCEYCLSRLPRIEYACKQCGSQRCNIAEPVWASEHQHSCKNQSIIRDKTFSAFHYSFPIDTLIHRFKYQQQLPTLNTLAQIMVDGLSKHPALTDHVDGVIPVPLHPNKIKERGFNQCYWLAKRLCEALKIPLMNGLCIRIINTAPQYLQSAQHRRSNLQQAFQLNEKVPTNLKPLKKHLVIVDDVITTGATVEAIAKLLKQAGAQKVSVWTLASAYG